jgi:NodT family efflux transporter outer membrane factor (OMF) lipoprotein
MKLLYLFLIKIAILVAVLTGCTVGPRYHAPTPTLPSHYISRDKHFSSNSVNVSWWDSLGDPILIDLIKQAVCDDNLDIKMAQAKVRQARAQLGIVDANFFPQLNASGDIARYHLSANGQLLGLVPFPISQNYTDYKLGFDASWELDFFGRTRHMQEASSARLQSIIENQNDVAITTAAEVAKIYIQYRVYQQRITIAKHTIASYAQTAKLVKLQMQAGSATGVDLQRVESEVLSAQSALPPLQAEARATLAALAVMVGDYPEALYTQLYKASPIPVINAKYISVGLPSDLLLRRPDVRVAERELAAATADIGVAVADQFPRFQLVGDLGFDTLFPGTYLHAASRYWNWGPQLSIPVFQGGRLKSAVKEQEAARDIALATYQKSILQALSDVEASLIRYDRERTRNQKLRASYNKLKSAAQLIKLQYRDGQTSLIDVLDVERQIDQLDDEHAQSAGLVAINFVSLYKALGGEWVSESQHQTVT